MTLIVQPRALSERVVSGICLLLLFLYSIKYTWCPYRINDRQQGTGCIEHTPELLIRHDREGKHEHAQHYIDHNRSPDHPWFPKGLFVHLVPVFVVWAVGVHHLGIAGEASISVGRAVLWINAGLFINQWLVVLSAKIHVTLLSLWNQLLRVMACHSRGAHQHCCYCGGCKRANHV